MKTHTIGVIMNGVTGRMGANQHLIRSIHAIREQGGVKVADDEADYARACAARAQREQALRPLAERCGDLPWSTDMDALLKQDKYQVYFDAQTTDRRVPSVRKAIDAGKHVYCEKPTATRLKDAVELYQYAEKAGVKNGVVQDRLWLPGLLKLKYLIGTGFFGQILSVRGEFGYWVFTGERQPAQRPSWNYRKKDGGGIIIDMLCHWRYVIDNLFGNITSLTCLGANHIKKRWDEQGQPYDADCDDAAYATFVTEKGIICHFNSSWCVRVRRDDLLTIQVDGTNGSAVAGLRECAAQRDANTPRPVWNPDVDNPIDFRAGWDPVPANTEFDNAFKVQWELFLRHVALDEPFRWTLKEGAKGVQLAELGLESWRERRWLDVPGL